ncbi:MAG TPA: MFS transporter [Candidatus Bathyarchaeia archaeon]|nr:MFS transporter [Candidatus Bathyarchaeia archaeon]
MAFRATALGAWMGWVMDSYDLSMMFLLIVPMSLLFFPKEAAYFAIVGTLSVYFLTLVFRPLGGFIFGILGDKLGRRESMLFSLTGLGAAVFLTGLLPTYATVGIMAPILLAVMRAIIGVFAGGEYGNSATILMEEVSSRNRGKVGGFLQGGYPVGFTLAAVVYLIIQQILPSGDFLQLGWRIMFFTGLVPALAGLVIRLKMPESSVWHKTLESGGVEKTPIRTLFKNRSFFLAWSSGFFAMAGISWLYSLTVGFYPTILPSFSKIGPPTSTYVVIVAILTSLAGYLCSGYLSDYIGRRKAMALFAVLGSVSGVPGMYVILRGGFDLTSIIIAASLLAFFTTGAYGVMPSYLSEKFPTKIRSTGVGSAFNAGFIIGSWSSVVALVLGNMAGSGNLYWVVGMAIIVGELFIAVSVLMSNETYGKDLRSI